MTYSSYVLILILFNRSVISYIFLQNEKSVPNLKSRSFAADALRYMNEDLHIYNAMKTVDRDLVEQLREPHLLSDDILKYRN